MELALDEGEGIVNEGLADAVALGGDPVQGDLALGVGGLGEGDELGLAAIAAGVPGAVQGHHLVREAGGGCLYCGLSRQIGLPHVGQGGQMRTAPLEQGEFNPPYFNPQGPLHGLSQQGGQPAQLGMAEAVGGRGLGLGDKGSVPIVNALGDGHQAVAGVLIDPLYVGQKGLHGEIHLGEVDEVGAGPGPGGQPGGTGQPAGMAAHDLHDHHSPCVIDPGVLVKLHAGGGDVLGGAGIAGAVVGAGQVVVDGFGDPDDGLV